MAKYRLTGTWIDEERFFDDLEEAKKLMEQWVEADEKEFGARTDKGEYYYITDMDYNFICADSKAMI